MEKYPKADIYAAQVMAAKADEDNAKQRRILAEEKLIDTIKKAFPENQPKIEGSITYDLGEHFKVTITGKIKRTLNEAAYTKAVATMIPQGFDPIYESTVLLGTIPEPLLIEIENVFDPRDFTRSLVLDDKALKALREHHPDIYKSLATSGLFETKPQKTAITVIKK